MELVWLDDPRAADPALCGGKAAALAALARRHPVPPGFCLTVQGLAGGPGDLPAGLAEAIEVALERLGASGATAVAVRSSAIGEDGAADSYAGQYETALHVEGHQAVLEAIAGLLRSVGAERVRAYRRQRDQGGEAALAILVQAFVPADAAAVAFSADPTGNAPGAVVINAAWGLGEALVGGLVTPDQFFVHRGDPTQVRAVIADKATMTVASPGGCRHVPVPAFLRREPALTAAQASALAALALELERETGRPVDIEAAFAGGRLHLLQCRPITTPLAFGADSAD